MKSKSTQNSASEHLGMLSGIIEGSSDFIAALNSEYSFIVFNSAFKNEFIKLFNVEIEIGTNIVRALVNFSEEQKRIVQYFDRALKGEKFTVIEKLGNNKSINSTYEVSFNSIKDAKDDSILGVSLIARDISEKIREEEKILHLNRLYALLSQINQLIVRIKDREKLFVESTRIAVIFGQFRMSWIGIIDEENHNMQVAAYHGYSNGFIENLNFSFSSENKNITDPLTSSIEEGKYFIVNDIEKDGITYPWYQEALDRDYKSCASFPIKLFNNTIGAFTFYSDEKSFFSQSEIELIIKLTHDISFALESIENEKNKLIAEEELRKLNEELEGRVTERTAQLKSVNKELEAFAYTVSHDLRSPLRHISGFISLLSKRLSGKLDDQNKSYLDLISQASRRMGMLIDDLLSFSKMNKNEMIFNKLDLAELVKTVIMEFKPEYENRKINWMIDEFPMIEGDPSMLKLIFTNLIGNAIKFTKTKETAEITIKKYDETKNNIVICVRDNGVGFDMNNVDKMFGVFQRLHMDEEFEGTGIGLAIVKRIVDRHGGKVWAEGKVNEGAAFFISFPLR